MSNFLSTQKAAHALDGDLPLVELVYGFEIPKDLRLVLTQLIELDPYNKTRLLEYDTVCVIKNLYEGFINKFKRLPKVFIYLIEIIHELNVELTIERFDVKSMRYALSLHQEIPSIYHRITYGIMFNKRIYGVINNLTKNNRNLLSFISGLPCKYPLLDAELENWVVKHAGKTKNETIHEVMAYWDEPGFPRESSLEIHRNYFSLNRKDMEWERCCKKYPEFFNQTFTTNLDLIKVEIANQKAYILDPNDRKQVLLGQLTVCCQRLGGSAEASMMEGLLNPDSGFLVFEKGDKVLAQSWVWLSKDKEVLVLDNIEFADNRQPIHIIHLLKEWLKHVPYKNVQMGLGFNQMSIGEPVATKKIYWYNQVWKQRYTDANQRVWLKKNNKIII